MTVSLWEAHQQTSKKRAADVLKRPACAKRPSCAKEEESDVLKRPASKDEVSDKEPDNEESDKESESDKDKDQGKQLESEGQASTSAPQDRPLHRLKITTASQPARSYIQACKCDTPDASKAADHRYQLIVEYKFTQEGARFKQKAEKALQHMKDHKMTWTQARDIKTALPQ